MSFIGKKGIDRDEEPKERFFRVSFGRRERKRERSLTDEREKG